MFGGDFPGWTLSLDMAYPIGTLDPGGAAGAGAPAADAGRSASSRASSWRSRRRCVTRRGTSQTNAKRVDATRSSRVLAERRLEAEEKKYQAGMTQNFFVLQAQRDLNVARNNELLALVEYAKSVVNYTAVQQAPLSGGGQQLQQQQQQ